ncbi:GNAT family N-acetyltransferase [Dongia rigui]|uniref:GNAT family N-acetyltransferase n=1 Tax=Dongia rigui TaxID=940149 RepID=A0ABU5DVJ0_9PROT|nr:GNAT family N-acetyltransferase [Dongia rigui]MDY0871322.1 GNAT family N-acetyltransferase [Dongia rigui]
MTNHFRRAGPHDAALVEAITHRAYQKWVPVIGRAPKPMTADYALAVRDHVIDLLIEGDVVAGLVELIPMTDHWLIENVAVDPAQQGKGYGRILVAHAEELTRAAGFDTIRLYTNKLFAANVTHYQKLGYTHDREEDFRGGIIVHMSKRL